LTDPTRIRGRHLSYQRSRHVTHPGTSLIKIEGVDNTNAAKYVSADAIEGGLCGPNGTRRMC